MAEKFYSLGNAIAGFGIAQSVALMIATVSSGTLQALFEKSGWVGPLLVFICGILLYGISVLVFWQKEMEFRKINNSGENLTTFEFLFKCRLGAIVVFYILSAAITSLF